MLGYYLTRLSNENRKQVGHCNTDIVGYHPLYIFGSAVRWRAESWGDCHQNARRSDFHPCAKFKPNKFSSFVGDTSQTTYRQTANLISPDYDGKDNKR